MTVVDANLFGETPHLRRLEVVILDGDTGSAEAGDQLGGLLDRLGPLVVRGRGTGHAASAGADDGRTGLPERGGDPTASSSCRSRHHGGATAQRVGIRRPLHRPSIAGARLPGRTCDAGAVTTYRVRFEGPAALALRVARALADADGVDLTASDQLVTLENGRVALEVTVEGAFDPVADAVARVRGELPSGASIEITGG
jgi:hypothetical protein